jgi:signal transduction histidine kinase
MMDEKNETEEKQLEYENKIKAVYMPADKIRITQVTSNLLNSVIKFTEEGIIKILIEKNLMN